MSKNIELIESAANIVDTEPTEKQPTVPGWAISALQSGEIRQMSKGVIAYECLMMADNDHSDSFTNIESNVTTSINANLIDMLDEMVSDHISEAKTRLNKACDYLDDYSATTKLQFPPDLVSELPSYEAGYHIADAVAYVYASPWSSRHERLSDIQDLVALIDGRDVDNPSNFVQSVIDGESAKYDVQDLHNLVSGELEIWEQPGFDLAKLRSVADDITQTPEYRIPALESALEAEDDVYTHSEIIDIAEEVYECSVQSARNYADGVNVGDAYKLDLQQVVDDIAAQVDPKKELSTRNYRRCGFEKMDWDEFEDEMSGVYDDNLEYLRACAQVRQKLLSEHSINSDSIPSQVKQGHERMCDWYDNVQQQARQN
ncbi:hypothetical protein [Haloarcula amylolytica]|uniref:hypothetical protein n=1 Tax=Haloarcula amylolytica TaxID=396317 RepID=UPI003C70AA70